MVHRYFESCVRPGVSTAIPDDDEYAPRWRSSKAEGRDFWKGGWSGGGLKCESPAVIGRSTYRDEVKGIASAANLGDLVKQLKLTFSSND